MILYSACNDVYFDWFYHMWEDSTRRHYPELKRYLTLLNGRPDQIRLCQKHKVIVNAVTQRSQLPGESDRQYKGLLFLLRWQHLPWQQDDLILETQINCLPIRRQYFNFITMKEHLRIGRMKRGKIAGLSAAVFTAQAAKSVAIKAQSWESDPPLGDHEINEWTSQNIPWTIVLAEQQFKDLRSEIEPQTCWITSGTSAHFTLLQKQKILSHYLKKARNL